MYFVLSGILQLVVWFIERDAIMFTLTPAPTNPPGGDGTSAPKPKRGGPPVIGLRIRSSFPRFQVRARSSGGERECARAVCANRTYSQSTRVTSHAVWCGHP